MRNIIILATTAAISFALGAMLFQDSSTLPDPRLAKTPRRNNDGINDLHDEESRIDALARVRVRTTGPSNPPTTPSRDDFPSGPSTAVDASPTETPISAARASRVDAIEQALATLLQAYPGERPSPLDLINRAGKSRDPSVRALSFQYLQLTSSPAEANVARALRAISRINETTAFAAESLASPEWAPRVPDAELIALFEKQSFPRNWGAAIALNFRGDDTQFKAWARQAQNVVDQRKSERVIWDILKACRLYPVDIIERVAISGARHEDVAIVKRAAAALYQLGTHAATLELQILENHESEELRAAALQARLGFPF